MVVMLVVVEGARPVCRDRGVVERGERVGEHLVLREVRRDAVRRRARSSAGGRRRSRGRGARRVADNHVRNDLLPGRDVVMVGHCACVGGQEEVQVGGDGRLLLAVSIGGRRTMASRGKRRVHVRSTRRGVVCVGQQSTAHAEVRL